MILDNPAKIVSRPLLQDMTKCGHRKSEFGMSSGLPFQASLSNESLAHPNQEKPAKKVNPYILTRKLNSKLQAMSAKLTDIMVWTKEVKDSPLLSLGRSF